MIATGLPVKQAHAILGTAAAAVTAAGTNQSTATQLTADHNLITACDPGQGVILPAMTFGDEVWVANGDSDADLLVYPRTGGKLNNQTANTPLSVATGRAAVFRAIGALDCLVIY
jgi:hypothetical protein